MYRIERTDWGFELEFGGNMSAEEVQQWYQDWAEALKGRLGPFSVFVDMRTLIPLSKEAMIPLGEGQRLARQSGMIRSVVIVQNPATASQFRRIAGDTGINQWERYIDAISFENWKELGMNWILQGLEPAPEKHLVRSI